MPVPRLLAALRAELKGVADPRKAARMQAYMRSAMPYLGVPLPLLRATGKRVFAAVELPSAEIWRDAVLTLWRGARHREERYAAIELSGDRRARAFQTPAALPMYEEMIVTGAWWDYVDEIAVHRLGPLLRRHPRPLGRAMRAWSRSRDLWKRRSAILCQNAFKRDTDLDLLHACIEPSLGSSEFFLRKAIGWALREYAWTDPREVVRYVRACGGRLSALSRREALRNLAKSRADGSRALTAASPRGDRRKSRGRRAGPRRRPRPG